MTDCGGGSLGSDPAITGKVIRLNAAPATITGVAPPGVLSIGERAPDRWVALGSRGTNPSGEIKPADPALLLCVATAAALIPARRASHVDPMVVLRYE